MNASDDSLEFYLRKLRDGQFDDAFHGLIEMDHSVLPKLIEAFKGEADANVRAELINIIWNHRQNETISFLGEALRDESPKVWRNALDGLVTLGSGEALRTLKDAMTRPFNNVEEGDEFRRWLVEAIDQVAGTD